MIFTALLALLLPLAQAAIVETRNSKIWKPKLNTTFILDLDSPLYSPVVLTQSGLRLNEKVYHVDMEATSADEIAEYHKQGKKVSCYISAGTWEPKRLDKSSFNPTCYCGPGIAVDANYMCTGPNSTENRLDGWNEWYLDIHDPECIKNVEKVQLARIKSAKAKGCDGLDPDNVDSYSNVQTYGTTPQDEVNYLMWWSKTARQHGMFINLKNAGDLLFNQTTNQATQWQKQLVDAFDYNVIEQCHLYQQCDQYDSFLAAGKPQIQLEYLGNITSCPDLKNGQHLLSYGGADIHANEIILTCNE